MADESTFSETLEELLVPLEEVACSAKFADALARARNAHPKMKIGFWIISRPAHGKPWRYDRLKEMRTSPTYKKKQAAVGSFLGKVAAVDDDEVTTSDNDGPVELI
ncbi:MAG: hypothetical protein AAGD43_07970 [Pseudomonadota bacterium]